MCFCGSLRTLYASGEWKQAIGPWKWSFPRDHGAHPEFRTEWWYFTGNLADRPADVSDTSLPFFARESSLPANDPKNPWSIRDIYLAHFTLTDVPPDSSRMLKALQERARACRGSDGPHGCLAVQLVSQNGGKHDPSRGASSGHGPFSRA